MKKIFTSCLIVGLALTANSAYAQCTTPVNFDITSTPTMTTLTGDADDVVDIAIETSVASLNRHLSIDRIDVNNVSLPFVNNGNQGLTDGTTYYYAVRTDCNSSVNDGIGNNANVSPWSEIKTFVAGGTVTCEMPTNVDAVSNSSSTTFSGDYPDGTTVELVIDTNPYSTNQNIELDQMLSDLTLPMEDSNHFGLTVGTEYFYRFRTDCGNGEYSEWTEMMSFIVGGEETCTVPTDILLESTVSNNTLVATTDFPVDIAVETSVAALNRHKATNRVTLNNVSLPYTDSRTIGLTNGRTYYYALRADCDVDNNNTYVSDWSENHSFVAGGTGTPVVSPNPVSGSATISGVNAAKVTVLDLQGNVKHVQNVTNNQVNLSGLQSGNYIIQVEDTNGKVSASQIMKK